MKTYFEASPEVQEKIKALFDQLHAICAPLNLPMIAAVGVSGNEERVQFALSARLNSETHSAPSAMVAACEIMKIGDVPEEVIGALMEMNSDTNTCTCPKCQARRLNKAKVTAIH